MYTVDKYINYTLALTNSLVIKLLDIGIQINKDLYIKYGISTPSDKRMWRYFLNLAGLPHETNSEVIIHVVELNEDHVLTRELLATYIDTRIELLKFGQSYDELLVRYPDDEQFIKGALLPVDIDYAIAAKDGTLLNYDNGYVENQELGLVRGIGKYTTNYLARWHVREYTLTDELYLAGMLGTLYGSLPNYIMNHRLESIYSNEAHSFHLEHFFRSHLDIWDDLSIVNDKTKWWLYNNLRYLIKHVGKNSTLKSIIDNIFTANGVGIGRLALSTEDPEIVEDIDNVLKSIYKAGDSIVLSEGLNPQYILDDNNIQSTQTVITNQMRNLSTLETDLLKDRADTYSEVFFNEINKVDNITQQTKIFDINTVKLFSMYGVDLMQVVIENWIHQAFELEYDRNQYFIDPNTKLQYTLSPKQGVLYLLKVLLATTGEDDIELNSFHCYHLLNNGISKDVLNNALLSRTDMKETIDVIMPFIPPPTSIVSPGEFLLYMDKVVKLYRTMWLLDSNTENLSYSSDMKVVSDRINRRTVIEISEEAMFDSGADQTNGNNGWGNGDQDAPGNSGDHNNAENSADASVTINQLLENEGITLNITENYDKHNTIRELILLFTGIEIDMYEEITRYTEKFINIFNKLTSYTTQILTSSEDIKHLDSMYTNISVNNLTEGYITVAEATNYPLEQDMTWIQADGNDFLDRLDGFNSFNAVAMVNDGRNIMGLVSNYNQQKELLGYSSRPLVSVEVLRDVIPFYAPRLDADANDFNVYGNELLTYNTNDLRGVRDITPNEAVAYTEDNTTDKASGVTSEPNVTVEIGI